MYTTRSCHLSTGSNANRRAILGLATRMQRSFKTIHKKNQLLLRLFGFVPRKILKLRNQSFDTLMSQFACGSKRDSIYIFSCWLLKWVEWVLCSEINETKLSITSTKAGEKKSAFGISVYKHLFQLKYITLLLTLIKQTYFGSFLQRQYAAFIDSSQRIKVGEASV